MKVIAVTPRQVGYLLAVNIAVLEAGNGLALILRHGFKQDSCFGVIPFFHFDHERNLPTFISALLFVNSAMLLGLVAAAHASRRSSSWRWRLLAIVFVFLAVDEFSSIHEEIGEIMRSRFAIPAGPLYFAWMLPYFTLLSVLLIVTGKLLKSVPPDIAKLLVTAGILFVAGAIGVEMIGGDWYSKAGDQSWVYGVMTTVEESLELLGLSLFIFALCCYLVNLEGSALLGLTDERSART